MAAAKIAGSQNSFRMLPGISLNAINFYMSPSKKPMAPSQNRIFAAPENRPSGDPEKKTRNRRQDGEDESVDKFQDRHQVNEGKSKGNLIIIKDDESDSDSETEGVEAGSKASACTTPLNLEMTVAIGDFLH
ncbi:hypothetical protein K469DRAFT_717978 [Zopfia rhizophila CBS 207.26]|uniref:Uncharacterized protein n=1 Tax=Zopfia rhizophila CBS 207.26 TaxID=1314779 RepID=A0A6A6DIH9_9PEZI|nr:hypothetical protein K469DRAFT_717978 [Zopfia rhizophila CBS 207.26]